MSQLMLHCGAAECTRQDVVNFPVPQATETWRPPAHADFLEHIKLSLERFGYSIEAEGYGMHPKRGDMFGAFELDHETWNQDTLSNDIGTILGFRASYSKRFADGIAIGTHVFICDNLALDGEIVIKHKATKNQSRNLPFLILQAIAELSDRRAAMLAQCEQFKLTQIPDNSFDRLAMECMRQDIVPASRLMQLDTEWRTPSHEEFTEDGQSVWRFHNAATEVLKNRGTGWNPAWTINLNKLCRDYVAEAA